MSYPLLPVLYMTSDEFLNIFSSYQLNYAAEDILNSRGSFQELMYESIEEITKEEIVKDQYPLRDQIFFSMNTEYVPTFMILTPKRRKEVYLSSIIIHPYHSSFSPSSFLRHKHSAIQISLSQPGHHYSLRGMTLVHKAIEDDASSIRIVFTLVAHCTLFEELKGIFDTSREGKSKADLLRKTINENPGKLQLWVDDQLCHPSNVLFIKNERSKVKKYIIEPLKESGVIIKYMNQNLMRDILSPYSQDSGKFGSLVELERDKKFLLDDSLSFFENTYKNARI